MPKNLHFIQVDMQDLQRPIDRLVNIIVPDMLSCITCLVFFFCLLISCTNHETAGKPDDSGYLWISRSKNFLDIYNLCLNARNESDSFLFKQQYLDSIIDHEKEYVSDSARKLLRDAYYNRAIDYDDASNYITAKNDFEKVLTLAQKIGYDRPRQQFMTFNRLANIYNRLGDINRSLNMRKQQLEFSEQTNDISFLIPTYINLGILYDDIGDFREAINQFKTGLRQDSLDEYEKGKLLSSLASVYTDINLPDSAFICVNKSFECLDSFDYKEDILEWRSSNFLTLAKIYDSRNDTDNKNSSFRKAIQVATEYEGSNRVREIGKILLTFCSAGKIREKDISNIHSSLYTVTNVDTNNIFSLPKAKELYAENTIMEALDAKAEWMTKYFIQKEKRKYWQCAVDCYDLSFEVERKLLLNFSYDESKIRMLKESRQRSEKAIALCYTLYQETKDEQWLEKAFRFAERNKAFIVLESIRRNLAASQVVQNDTFFQKVQQLQMEYSYAEKSLLEAKNINDTSQLKQLEDNRNKTDKHLQLAKTSLYQNNSGYRQWMEQEDSISINIARKLLPDDHSVLVEYFMGDSSSYGIIISAGGPAHFISISNDHVGAIDSFQYFFRNKNNIPGEPGAYQQTANTVYLNWLKPCIDGFAGNKLLIIPDGKLIVLPFDALITQVSESNNLQSWSYLVKEYQVDIGYSVSTLIKQKDRRQSKGGVIAFAPGFTGKERNLSALPFTFEEVDNITGSKTVIYRNKNASIGQFRRSAPTAVVIHIASHARADSSGTVPVIEFADSTLLLNELYAMHVNADLVVLSACQTGIGKIEKSEGAMSLARGFYYAGAKNIITSLWNINDQSTAILFKSFYGNIDNGQYSYALYNAKKKYIASQLSNDKYSPYYWASFIYIGSENMNGKIKSNKWPWLAGIVLISAFLLFWLRKNKKRIGKNSQSQ